MAFDMRERSLGEALAYLESEGYTETLEHPETGDGEWVRLMVQCAADSDTGRAFLAKELGYLIARYTTRKQLGESYDGILCGGYYAALGLYRPDGNWCARAAPPEVPFNTKIQRGSGLAPCSTECIWTLSGCDCRDTFASVCVGCDEAIELLSGRHDPYEHDEEHQRLLVEIGDHPCGIPKEFFAAMGGGAAATNPFAAKEAELTDALRDTKRRIDDQLSPPGTVYQYSFEHRTGVGGYTAVTADRAQVRRLQLELRRYAARRFNESAGSLFEEGFAESLFAFDPAGGAKLVWAHTYDGNEIFTKPIPPVVLPRDASSATGPPVFPEKAETCEDDIGFHGELPIAQAHMCDGERCPLDDAAKPPVEETIELTVVYQCLRMGCECRVCQDRRPRFSM